MLFKALFAAILGVVLFSSVQVEGHGRLLSPPSRNSIWRIVKDKNLPKEYTDNELSCGGFARQWQQNKGQCGVCGDAFDVTPRFVYPGKFATGYIGKVYKKGATIDVKVQITSNHKGWFEFRVGDIGTAPITQAKLKYLLMVKGPTGTSTRYMLPPQNGIFDIKVILPSDLVCKHCVFQWWYKTGNSWGCEIVENGKKECGNGLGAQETFVNCADIAIMDDGSSVTMSTTKPSTTKSMPETTTAATTKATTKATTTKSISNGICTGKADGPWKGQPKIDEFCNRLCNVYCPKGFCLCTTLQ